VLGPHPPSLIPPPLAPREPGRGARLGPRGPARAARAVPGRHRIKTTLGLSDQTCEGSTRFHTRKYRLGGLARKPHRDYCRPYSRCALTRDSSKWRPSSTLPSDRSRGLGVEGVPVPVARRRPEKDRTFVAHRARPAHKKRHPTHVTLRARRGSRIFAASASTGCCAGSSNASSTRRYRDRFQVVHYSIQSNHLHSHRRVERQAHDAAPAVSGLVIAFAKRLNKLLERLGKVWSDSLSLPRAHDAREVRRALVYVLQTRAQARLRAARCVHRPRSPRRCASRGGTWP